MTKGASREPECHPKGFLIKERVINERAITVYFVGYERVVGNDGKSKADKEDGEKHFLFNLAPAGHLILLEPKGEYV